MQRGALDFLLGLLISGIGKRMRLKIADMMRCKGLEVETIGSRILHIAHFRLKAVIL